MADKSRVVFLDDSEVRTFPKNVMSFLEQASSAYGKYEADGFSQYLFCDIFFPEEKSLSPIESLFQIALELQIKVLRSVHWIDAHLVNDRRTLSFEKQAVIGKYRVDFLLTYQQGANVHKLIVELDGHDFHEKNKKQRSYEKARDRFLIKAGYRVIHFTGSDVVADPHQVVFESLSMLGIRSYKDAEHIDDIDPNDMLGRRYNKEG